MYLHRLIKTTALSLVFSLLALQITPALADSKKINVAFVGIQLDDLPEDQRKRILERIENLLKGESALQTRGAEEVRKILGTERVAALLKDPDGADFAAIADELQADYIYAGTISNNARAGERTLLVGELYRYDRASNLRHKFAILKYYDGFGVEVVKFRNQFVRTIIKNESTRFKLLPVLVLGGIAIAGILTFIFVSAEGAIGGGSIGEPDPPSPIQ